MENEKLFEFMSKMYSEMKEDLASVKGDLVSVKGDLTSVKGDLVTVKGDLASVKEDVKTINNTVIKIELEHDEKLSALFDDYKQNSDKLNRIEKEVTKHDDFILKRVFK